MTKVNFFSYSNTVRFFLILFFCIALILPVMTGCDDKDSTEAKLFDAEEALDDGNWDKAIAILNSLGTSEEVLQYLSNAYAGQVGINTFDLLTTIDELDNENSGQDESGSIDMIGKLIGAENDVLTCNTISDKLDTISDAIYNINQISAIFGNLDDDQTVQLGLASLTRTVLIIAKLICLQTGEPEITMTEAWITDYRDTNGLEISEANWTLDSFADMLIEDITNVGDAVSVMSEGNDIKDDFDQFKAELDNGAGAGDTASDNIISRDELNHYLATM